jgi:uncharacterized protein
MEKVAIIGTGIAGMGCGHFLNDHFDLTFFEQNNYIGGHTNTVYVTEDSNQIPVDTGFIVFNEATYPNLLRLLRLLKVDIKPTPMSFSVQHKPSGLEYSSQRLFAQRKNLWSPSFIRMLFQINRFYSESEELLHDDRWAGYSLHDYVNEKKYGDRFLYQYLVPMSSALWSTPTDITLQYPARVLVQFFKNHGLLGTDTQLSWYTVHRGSWQYRDKLIAPFKDKIRIGTGVKNVNVDGVKPVVQTTDGSTYVFDKIIFACHADQALRMMESPTPIQSKLLSPFRYQKNVALLHTDEKVMPRNRSAWSAWNYRVDNKDDALTATTIYDMNCLQQVSARKNYFVSIDDPGLVNPSKVIRKMDYEHPVFTTETARAQKELHVLNETGPLFFCGSYFRFGFHEDALTSAVDLCSRLLGGNAWETGKLKNPKHAVSS